MCRWSLDSLCSLFWIWALTSSEIQSSWVDPSSTSSLTPSVLFLPWACRSQLFTTRWPSLFPGPAVYMFSVNLKSHLSERWDGSQTIRAVFDNFGCSKSNLSSLLSIFEFLWWVSASPIPFSARRRHALPAPFSAPSPAFPYMLLFLWIGYSASSPAAAAAPDRGPAAGLLTVACPFESWYRCFLPSSSCTMDTVLPQQYQGLSQSSPATPSTLLSCRLYLQFP